LPTLVLPLSACLVLVVVLGLILWPAKTHQIAALPEVANTNLIHFDGRWCQFQTGHTNPFTGFLLEYYPSGPLQSRSMVSNGLLEGLSEVWHTNGQLQIREYYRTNFSDGPRTKWYSDGKKLSEATIVLGKMQGVFRRWYENGRLAEKIPMQDGKIEGVGKSYYESGYLKTELTISNGEVIQTKNWPDGERSGDN
jgi:antitoxin component YwqK of YwqJK toxin-antitoxin module